MNEKYLLKLQQDMLLKNFTPNTCEDYYRFVKRFLDFANKDAMSITYADIRKFIFYMKDAENKKLLQSMSTLPRSAFSSNTRLDIYGILKKFLK